MRELIKDVAEVVRDLETLNLLDGDVVTEIRLNSKTKKNALKVSLCTHDQEILCICLEMFQKLREKGHSMGVLENDLFSRLTVEFYEQ